MVLITIPLLTFGGLDPGLPDHGQPDQRRDGVRGPLGRTAVRRGGDARDPRHLPRLGDHAVRGGARRGDGRRGAARVGRRRSGGLAVDRWRVHRPRAGRLRSAGRPGSGQLEQRGVALVGAPRRDPDDLPRDAQLAPGRGRAAPRARRAAVSRRLRDPGHRARDEALVQGAGGRAGDAVRLGDHVRPVQPHRGAVRRSRRRAGDRAGHERPARAWPRARPR